MHARASRCIRRAILSCSRKPLFGACRRNGGATKNAQTFGAPSTGRASSTCLHVAPRRQANMHASFKLLHSCNIKISICMLYCSCRLLQVTHLKVVNYVTVQRHSGFYTNSPTRTTSGYYYRVIQILAITLLDLDAEWVSKKPRTEAGRRQGHRQAAGAVVATAASSNLQHMGRERLRQSTESLLNNASQIFTGAP